MPLKFVEKAGPVRFKAMRFEIAKRDENPWSIPTSVATSSASRSTSQPATPFRVQDVRGDGGGRILTGAASAFSQLILLKNSRNLMGFSPCSLIW